MRNRIQPYGYFTSLAAVPERLLHVINTYFITVEVATAPEDIEPTGAAISKCIYTVPALCIAMGTTVKAMKEYMVGDDSNIESVYYITQAITFIEDWLVQEGLIGRNNANMTKFVLGAYCDTEDVNRKSAISIGNITNNTLQIGWASPEDIKPELPGQFAHELEHLKNISVEDTFRKAEEEAARTEEDEEEAGIIDVVFETFDDIDDI